jgi:hypothetical protein
MKNEDDFSKYKRAYGQLFTTISLFSQVAFGKPLKDHYKKIEDNDIIIKLSKKYGFGLRKKLFSTGIYISSMFLVKTKKEGNG